MAKSLVARGTIRVNGEVYKNGAKVVGLDQATRERLVELGVLKEQETQAGESKTES